MEIYSLSTTQPAECSEECHTASKQFGSAAEKQIELADLCSLSRFVLPAASQSGKSLLEAPGSYAGPSEAAHEAEAGTESPGVP